MITPVLAKSDGETLAEHTRSCLRMFRQLADIFPDLDIFTHIPSFYSLVFQALFLHDIGKASEEFQKYLKHLPNSWNSYRHEILSTPFVDLLTLDEAEKDIVKCLILTHHKDLQALIPYFETAQYLETPFSDHISHLSSHQDYLKEFFQTFSGLASEYGYGHLSLSLDFSLSTITKSQWESVFQRISRCINQDDAGKEWFFPIGIAGKGMVNASDYLASGGVKEILKPLPDMRSIFPYPDLTSVQKQALSCPGDAIIISPTGSGKTEAALFWATGNLNQTKGSRVFYTLPYTASINALYQRLRTQLSEAYHTEDVISLIHGRAAYFLSKMYEDEQTSHHLTKISRQICSPYKIITPFQAIRHCFSLKGFEMGLLEMYQGVFIFDEIHSYNPRTVALILGMAVFLKTRLQAKIMLMSATLPSYIKTLFEQHLRISTTLSMEKGEQLRYLRHQCILLTGTLPDNLSKIIHSLRENKRVLVICNTVRQSQEIFRLLSPYAPNQSVLLHSKFILQDRERIESRILKGETSDSKNELRLLVGTQAIEVSLDIDYDLCFSEPAPIDALIQRFGRVNRRGKKGICPVYVCTAGSETDQFVYDPELVRRTIEELSTMNFLLEWEVQDAVDRVYSDRFGKRQEEFERTFEMFSDVLRNMVPLTTYDRDETEFYQLFDSIEAIPIRFITEVKEALRTGTIHDIMNYTLPLSKGQYFRLKKENRVSIDSHYLFIDVAYDSKVGLLLSSPETMIE